VPSEYDDELWALVPEEPGPPPGHVLEFVRSLGRREGSVLDLGCGDGRLTLELRGRHIVGADVSALALGRARWRLEDHDVDLVELTPRAVLPWGDATFDLVLMADTIEHVVDVPTLLAEAYRVTAPGGEIAVTTPAHSRRDGLSMLTRGFGRTFDPLSPHVRFFARSSLRDVLDEAGFEVQRMKRRKNTLLARALRADPGTSPPTGPAG
jgi:ubiquinone/menaquinone biosynthesis C-methylase UbiE